ncbi:proline iminopeptidase-family hydrolase [Algoriphagus sp. AK58]|uniref:proline iminopeptidase-family hydrolase n=1 Tax=Algoriphagus sp. AK58 TaxID=1406877 RepID=UPI00164FC6EB|nr:proline iminopeptidase-family hydrolase [Algoriphagus sp. AK58]MBC6366998.1 proline iminopeptidase [Algoriphagus sp. AK58]
MKKSPLFILWVIFCFSCQKESSLHPHEGFVEVTGGKIWYEVVGEGPNPPVLLLHGGPGSASFGFDPLRELDYNGPIIFWDQLGCGRSEALSDTTLMTIENFVDQTERLRRHLGLEDFVLYGHSWGSMLGIDYFLRYPEEVKAIIFSSPLFSTDRWIADADTLIATLPDSIQQVIRHFETTGEYDHPEYLAATEMYYDKYVTRKKQPKVDRSHLKLSSGSEIYRYMWGPSEFNSTGTLRDFDRLEDLSGIDVPTLLVCGEFDEARPETIRFYSGLIPGSRVEIIPDAAHSTLNDNREAMLKVIGSFLETVIK